MTGRRRARTYTATRTRKALRARVAAAAEGVALPGAAGAAAAAEAARRFGVVRDELRRARRPWLELPFATYVADASAASGLILEHVRLTRAEAGGGDGGDGADTCWVPWCKHSVLPVLPSADGAAPQLEGTGASSESQPQPEPFRSRDNSRDHALGPRPLSEAECMRQLVSLPEAVVAPSEGLLWCPTAKAGTTSILAMLNRKFNGAAVGLQRAHASHATDNYAGWRLTGNAAQQCVRADSMDEVAYCSK